MRTLAGLLLLTLSLGLHAADREDAWEYTFRPGDSLWKIAERYTTSAANWKEIQRINSSHLAPDRQIPAGTRILIPVAMLKVKPRPAKVVAVSGEPVLIRSDGERETPRIDTPIYKGDRIVTSSDQGVRVRFADESELQILAGSDVVFDKLGYFADTGMVDTRIRLDFGRVNSAVRKLRQGSEFHIRTPAALTAVRGTAFRLDSSRDGVTRTEVTEGTVGVSVGGVEKQVAEGFGLLAEQGKPLPDPVKLLPAPELVDAPTALSGRLQVAWSTLNGATAYRYRLALDAGFDQPVAAGTTAEISLQFGDLAGADYFFRVRGIDSNGFEGADATRSYRVETNAPAAGNVLDQVLPAGTLLIIQ